jgi:hypothetical protein
MTRFAGSSCCGHARIGDVSEHADNSIYDMYGHLEMNKLGRKPWDLDGFGVLHLFGKKTNVQWEFQDPKMEVLYHIRPYFAGIFPYIGLI